MSPWSALPKIELHLHLDCSLSFGVASRLDPHLSREGYDREFIAPPRCESLADYLTRAPRGFQLMQTGEALRLVTEDLFDQLAADRVIYAEVRFAPLLHTQQGLSAEAAVAAVDEAMESARRRTGIEARLILCTLRHFTEAQGLETAHLLDRFRGNGVAALDLAADEAGFPLDPHVAAFAWARERGHACTAHAGEALGPESVRETLARLAPTRLGHGVRSIEDPELIQRLVDQRIHLEVCPSSNVQTRVCESLEAHPLDHLFRAGVSLSLSTDARTITNVTLDDEYQRVASTFGWGHREFLKTNLDALEAAFVDAPTRERLKNHLIEGWGGEA